ncbi:MAG TPA: hypothetical protein VIN08_19055 [Ohtaekwangia sp.]|uniref:hypothetical protein n=1 Tax=Ohtaekwangia sp. TaxID=2066019 RepID=UPI002F947511
MNTSAHTSLFTLKNVLLINAVSSGITGVALIALASQVASLFGVTEIQAFLETGIFLVAFAAFVSYEGMRHSLRVKNIYVIIVLDIVWVIASAAIVVPQLFDLTAIGYIAISAVALWVAAMAYLQLQGVRQISAA